MTKRELRELIRSVIKEYPTGASGGNSTDGNNITSQRSPGGSFTTDEDEIEFYSSQNVYKGGKATSGMEPSRGNPNRSRFTKF